MKNLIVCRFCLATDTTFISISNKITAKNIVTAFGCSAIEDDGLPQYLCSFCCYLVSKFASFRRRCDIARTVFENIASTSRKVNLTYIKRLNRKSLDLCLPLIMEPTTVINTQSLPIDNVEFEEVIDRISDDKHSYDDPKEEFLISDDEDDLSVSPHLSIKEDSESKESIDNFSIREDSDSKESINNLSIREDSKESIKNFSIKEDIDSKESIDNLSIREDTCERIEEKSVNETKTEDEDDIDVDFNEEYLIFDDLDDLPDSSHLSIKEDSDTKEPIDIAKRNKKRIDGVKKNKKRVHIKFNEDFAVISVLSKAEQRKELQMRASTDSYIISLYKCKKCYKGFINKTAFNNHMLKHNVSSGDYMCDICEIRCSTSRALRSHVLKQHERRFACKQCNHITSNTTQARMHYKEHNNFLYKCKYCDLTYRKKSSYLGHVRLKHPSDDVCDICGASFIGPQGLKAHKRLSHSQKEPNNTESNTRPKFTCTLCDKCFTLKRNLIRHISLHTGPKLYYCEVCFKGYTAKHTLQDHMKHVHMGVPYPKRVRR